uniref:Uncharacterized protein LOC111100027 n=1 Tax=Crassostrea virginica TaxID=6565 RepID=A0A8B8A772_CRAVI|nr:uncharacterized protein LOC111100027 [Crassostrea virginica]
MYRTMKLMDKTKFYVFSVFLIFNIQVCGSTEYFTCVSCSGTDFTHNFAALQCLNDTDSITSGFIHCNSSWPCSHREQIDQRTGRVLSVLRGCEPASVGANCVPSFPHVDCLKFCTSEMCNNETNLWTEHKHEPGSNGDGSNGRRVTAVLPFILASLLVTILLHLLQ